MKTSTIFLATFSLFFSFQTFSQDYEWEIDKIRRRESQRQIERDSMLVHLKNKWQLSLVYNRIGFINSTVSLLPNSLDYNNNIGSINLSFSRYLTEHLSADLSIGFLMRKNEPDIDVAAVFAGDSIDTEGGGLIFIPMSIQLKYYITKSRLRPYIGIGLGNVSGSERYVSLEGTSDDLSQSESSYSSKAGFISFSSGLVYRAGKHLQLGVGFDSLRSQEFDRPLGGFASFDAYSISMSFSILF
jgi:outer membrane protein W